MELWISWSFGWVRISSWFNHASSDLWIYWRAFGYCNCYCGKKDIYRNHLHTEWRGIEWCLWQDFLRLWHIRFVLKLQWLPLRWVNETLWPVHIQYNLSRNYASFCDNTVYLIFREFQELCHPPKWDQYRKNGLLEDEWFVIKCHITADHFINPISRPYAKNPLNGILISKKVCLGRLIWKGKLGGASSTSVVARWRSGPRGFEKTWVRSY